MRHLFGDWRTGAATPTSSEVVDLAALAPTSFSEEGARPEPTSSSELRRGPGMGSAILFGDSQRSGTSVTRLPACGRRM